MEQHRDNILRAPIAEAMRAYAADGARAYHTPGHKQGLGAHPLLKALVTEEGLREEVSLMEELDDLHEPTMCIKEAQEMAAALYGADQAYFMINGTTGAIHTMLMGALRPGDAVLVPRNAHRSMIGGIILAGAQPVFLQPEVDERLGIAMGLTEEKIARSAITAHPEAKALACVYPTYYGVTFDLARIAALVHAHDMLLLVDEAHGPHLRFSEALPPQAIDCGADMAAQSTHKILGAMTQASMLLVNGVRVDRVREAASLLQSTSPNQLLLASLDIARLQMAENGGETVGLSQKGLAGRLRSAINAIDGLWSFGPGYTCYPGATGLDATKITVQVTGLGLSGVEAEAILRHEYKVQCELSDARNLLFILSYADTEEQADYLLEVLRQLARITAARQLRQCLWRPFLPPVPAQGMTPREAFFAPKGSVAFSEAEGHIAAEQVMFYPPGIPILCPGDVIDAASLRYIEAMQALGLKVVGPRDASLGRIQVVK